ncbi:MAG: hypothetical protein GC186_06360 [Rhodobacteraceae bacterium]|nr:hypothetical protein [Paracoccaceae bacterium]
MSNNAPRVPKRLHCRDLGAEPTGILVLSDERVELYFVGYEDFVYVHEDGPAYVVTEEGSVVSLHNNVPGLHSSRSVTTKLRGADRGHKGDEHRTIFQSGIISNLAVIGADAWRPDDLVRRLTFDVAHTEHILRHREKVRSLGRTTNPTDSDLTLYRSEAGNVTLVAGYAATYGIDTQSLTTFRPTFSIGFAKGCRLSEISKHLVHYVSFLSFVLGGTMAPTAVHIDRLSFDEMVRAVEGRTYVGDHEVMWNWSTEEYEPRELAFHGAPFVAEDDVELAAFEAGLVQWVNRADEWERAYIRMTESLRLRHVVSGERLLAAWRWFEELPIAKAERVLNDTAVERVIQAALEVVRDQGLADTEERVRGALTRIGEETVRNRFLRLIGSVQARFGVEHLLEMIDHLENARRFRGRVAHGHFAARDESETRRFNKAILAVESLCFLLTARDLPMTEASRGRIWSHPVLETFDLAYS